MPIYLSDQERQLISKHIKAARPTYFSSSFGEEVQISEDMEKFLILTPPDARNNTVAWLQDSNKKTKDKEDRESILKEALSAELQDSKAMLDEADAGLTQYDNFRTSYFKNVIPESSGSVGTGLKSKQERFAEVAEVGQALSDLSRSVEEFLVVRDRAKHLHVLASVLQARLSQGTVTANDKRQISSWATPFTAYTNGRT